MQFAAERASLSLTLGSLTRRLLVIDGSPPVGAVPDQFAAGFASAPRLLGSAVVSWPVRMNAPPSVRRNGFGRPPD